MDTTLQPNSKDRVECTLYSTYLIHADTRSQAQFSDKQDPPRPPGNEARPPPHSSSALSLYKGAGLQWSLTTSKCNHSHHVMDHPHDSGVPGAFRLLSEFSLPCVEPPWRHMVFRQGNFAGTCKIS